MSNQKYNTESIVENFRIVHEDKYDYSKVEYQGYRNKVIVTCPIHGDFEISISKHLQGQGCPKCRYIKSSSSKRRNIDDVIQKMKDVHGDRYDYSLITEYKNTKTKLPIICREHGVFYQTYDNHVRNKQNCPICGQMQSYKSHALTQDEFIQKSQQVHGDKYDYSKVDYRKYNEKVCIICPTHGNFYQEPGNHLNGQGCPQCFKEKSKVEQEILDFVVSIVGKENVITNDRELLNGREIDIYIPSLKLGFEVNGLIWHSEKYNIDKNYHLNKTLDCQKLDIHLIQIFEDEWLFKREIVKSRISYLLKDCHRTIYARKCKIKEIDYITSQKFLDNNHIQGNCISKYRFGLYYNDDLVSLMTFGKSRVNVHRKSNVEEYEMLRFCNKLNTNVVGGASKLFKYFIAQYSPKSVVSYADKRWSNGNLYKQLGFELYNESKPSYYYVIGKKRINRYNLRKDVLVKKYGCPQDVSEHQFCLQQKWYRIYDCGCYCFKFEKS